MAEVGLERLRAQVAVVRTLTEQIDRFARPENTDQLTEHIVEEMARLGCRLLEAAASMTRPPSAGESGVVVRPAALTSEIVLSCAASRRASVRQG